MSIPATRISPSDNFIIREAGSPTGPAEILLTEIVVTPTGGEFVEIYNGTGSAVDLSRLLPDRCNVHRRPERLLRQHRSPEATLVAVGFVRLPRPLPGWPTLGASEYQTVALNGSANFLAEYGVAPTYELYDDSIDIGETVMRDALPGSINGQGGLTNGARTVANFTIGMATSDLVTAYGLCHLG